MSKFARLLQVLNLLKSRQGISAKELALECQVSRRTIFRDILSLSSAEIPVYYEKGYRLLPGTFLPTLNFDLDEYLTLKSILSADLFNSRNFISKTSKSILSKIEINLNSELKEKLKEIYPPFSFSFNLNNGDKNQTLIFKILKQAILEKKSVILDYGIKEVFRANFEVDPFIIVFRGRKWYVVGKGKNHNKYFPFGLDYVEKVTLTKDDFILPKDFSLDGFFQHSWEVCQAEIVQVELKVSKENKYIVENISPFAENISKLKDGSTFYRLKVRGVNELARWLLCFPGMIQVKSPRELKERLDRLMEIQLKVSQQWIKAGKWIPACPQFKKNQRLCNDFCLDPVV
ncbi:MAG: WYL domain-containing protein [candidate division Zixibacteria bacterium]|nr:WYL domain-containing protein [candidate division Zixibacteria bacterium]